MQYEYIYHLKEKGCGSWPAKQCPSNPNCFVDLENKAMLDISREKLSSEVTRILGKDPSDLVKSEDIPHVGLKVKASTFVLTNPRTWVPHVT